MIRGIVGLVFVVLWSLKLLQKSVIQTNKFILQRDFLQFNISSLNLPLSRQYGLRVALPFCVRDASHERRRQFHQHFTYKFFVQVSFWQLWVWLWTNFCTKNAHKKRWWNWRQVSISSTFYVKNFRTNIVFYLLFGFVKKLVRKMCA